MFVNVLQTAAQKGALWVIKLGFQSQKASLLAAPFTSATRSSLFPGLELVPFAIQNDALCAAAVHGRVRDMAWLLEKPFEIDAPASLGQETALNIAVVRSHHAAVRLLLEAGADPNCQRSQGNMAPLHAAARTKRGIDAGILDILFQYGANVHLWDDVKFQPIHEAALNGHLELLRQFLDHGASVEAGCNPPQTYTPLMLASGSCKPSLVTYLLRAGANVNAKTGGWGNTALSLAVRDRAFGRPIWPSTPARSTIEALLKYGADVRQLPKFAGPKQSIIHGWLNVPDKARWDDDHLYPVIRKCVDVGGDVDTRNGHGRTPLEEIFFAHSQNEIFAVPLTVAALLQAGAYDNLLCAVCARQDWQSKHALIRYVITLRGRKAKAEAATNLRQLVRECAISEDEHRSAFSMLHQSSTEAAANRWRV